VSALLASNRRYNDGLWLLQRVKCKKYKAATLHRRHGFSTKNYQNPRYAAKSTHLTAGSLRSHVETPKRVLGW